MKISFILFFILTICCHLSSNAQDIHEISLTAEKLDMVKGGFYIDTVEDHRTNKEDIGFVKKGFFNKPVRAKLSGGLLFMLENYFNYSLPRRGDKRPIVVRVMEFEISEITEFSSEFAVAKVTIEYYYGTNLLYTSKEELTTRGLDVTKIHPTNISDVLIQSLRHFDRTNWQDKLTDSDTLNSIDLISADTKEQSRDLVRRDYPPMEKTNSKQGSEKRNVVTIGYQIGGFTLVGLDYEVRVSDNFGIHFGGGFAGYTAGLKVHTNAKKNSPFFNINYKDGGFGLLETAGLEFGGRIPFSRKRDFGLHLQAGFGKVLSADPAFSERLFGSSVPPDYMLTVGIGFGW